VILFYRQSKQRKLTNIELERKNELITEQKKEITDSIQYASRLQQAILPPDDMLFQLIPRHFIFFKPRDIVSGDYYYIAEKNGLAIIVTADCTGHGVPGALMSMLGTAILNEILGKMTDISPDHILNEMRSQIIRALHQSGRSGEHRDGMDLALYILDNANKQLYFAGANNPVIIARNGELIELKPDKMPIGIYEKGNIPFSSQCVPVLDNDMLYTFSDGILDQFGGPNGKKFMIKRFRELLIQISNLEESVQKDKINEAFLNWKGASNQIDDILVIGVRV
jgi:serine phosphatase RsbU (regulator of sigma subunit)